MTGADVVSKYKVAIALRTKRLNLCWKIYKKGRVFKYPKLFQCDNGSEFKSDVSKLLEKHNVDIRRTTTKYKELWNPLTKSWQNSCSSPWMLKSFKTQYQHKYQDKYQQFGLKILTALETRFLCIQSKYRKIRTRKKSVFGHPSCSDAIKRCIIKLDKSEKNPEESVQPEDGLCRYLYQPAEQHEGKKKKGY